MSIMEVLELTKAMEEKFGVSGDQIISDAIPEPVEEEATEFNLTLTGFAKDKKVSVIKVIREIANLGLMDSKRIIEALPYVLLESASKEEAANTQNRLEHAGGIVKVKGV